MNLKTHQFLEALGDFRHGIELAAKNTLLPIHTHLITGIMSHLLDEAFVKVSEVVDRDFMKMEDAIPGIYYEERIDMVELPHQQFSELMTAVKINGGKNSRIAVVDNGYSLQALLTDDGKQYRKIFETESPKFSK